jgi:hypothetical protein
MDGGRFRRKADIVPRRREMARSRIDPKLPWTLLDDVVGAHQEFDHEADTLAIGSGL